MIWWSLAINNANPVFQVAVYMGKRDFVDHCDFVDPVGERSIYVFILKLADTNCVNTPCVCPTDGVILIDPQQLNGRKGWNLEADCH